ncbi:1-acyl-sn-glycerol-3-phosphate acyltransferase [Candidatus Woesearchaeota archaeon]|nr:1-acyl-sn-glycerol-3-phosphate acyltransferase [Candidatus Woesearchaeota archaeon]
MFSNFILWIIYGPFLKLCSKILIRKINGKENLPQKKGFILAANHSSYLDIIALSTVLMRLRKKEVRYLAKKELVSNPIIKWIFKIGRQITFDREAEGQIVLQEAILTGKLQKGKTGVARLALWARVPVIPVGIKGTFELMPKGKIMPKFKKNIVINIGKPIYFDNYYKREIKKQILRKLTDKIMTEIAKLSNQRYKL